FVELHLRALHDRAYPLAEPMPAFYVDSARDDGELFATPAREHVFGTKRLFHQAGHTREHVVAGRMPEGVVDFLEVVEVEQQKAKRGAVALRVGELGGEAFGEVLAVVGAGEG